MGRYSIKELERLSGIKAHTLRIWEKRYNLFEPSRTDTNIREYSDDDLKNLLKISVLTKSGLKISKIVGLNEDELTEKVSQIEDEELIIEKKVDDLIFPMIEYDEATFSKLHDEYVNEFGVEKTYLDIIYPFLDKIGVLWLTDIIEPAQEHFITHLIRQKISAAIESLPAPLESARKVILFLPEGEFHELGLLFMSFTYKLKGILVYYLGQSIPVSQVCQTAEKIKPDWVLTYTVVNPKDGIQQLIDDLGQCETKKIYLFVNPRSGGDGYDYPSKIERINSFSEAVPVK